MSDSNSTLGFVLLSGGLDSAVTLAHAIDEHGSENVHAYTCSYGQRHQNKEQIAAFRLCEYFNVPIIELRVLLGEGGLTDTDLDIPNKSYEELGEGVSPTYVPFRNATLLSLMTSHADGQALKIGKEQQFQVYYGAHMDDAEGGAYPDCTPLFVHYMNGVIKVATYHRGRLIAPLINKKKWEVVRYGEGLRVPFGLTWSCYRGLRVHCGTCPTCIDRRNAFKHAQIADPTEYAA